MFELIKNHRKLENIDSLLNNFFNDTFCVNQCGTHQMDSYFSDDESNYYVELALPGLEKKDINLNINNKDLCINYEPKNDTDNSFWKKSFNRKIKLPNNIKPNGISAELKNGILSVIIKKENVKKCNKTIEIK